MIVEGVLCEIAVELKSRFFGVGGQLIPFYGDDRSFRRIRVSDGVGRGLRDADRVCGVEDGRWKNARMSLRPRI